MLCDNCSKRSTCRKLCKEAEAFASQDEVKQRELTLPELIREYPLEYASNLKWIATETEMMNPKTAMPWRSGYHLTKTEKQILTLLAKGFSRADVCELMNISRHTLRQHLSNAKKKREIS